MWNEILVINFVNGHKEYVLKYPKDAQNLSCSLSTNQVWDLIINILTIFKWKKKNLLNKYIQFHGVGN